MIEHFAFNGVKYGVISYRASALISENLIWMALILGDRIDGLKVNLHFSKPTGLM